MNISSGWRDRRTFMPPLYYPYANYSTDSKNTMSKTFAEEMFLNNFHLGPDALRKNLADTIVTQEKMAPKNNKNKLEEEDLRVEEDSQMHVDASRLSGLSNFFSGVLNVISNAMFSKRKPDHSSNSGQNMALPSMWQDAKLSDENKNVQAENPSDDISSISSEFFVSDMSDCRSAAAHCQSKLDQVRSLLGADKPSQCSLRVRRRPKKVFVEPSHVEDCFEDAFSPEDFENLANNSFIEYYSPVCYHDQTYHELDSPKCKIEEPVTSTVTSETPVAKSSEVSDSPNVLSGKYTVETDIPNVMQVLKLIPENTEVGNELPKMGSENPTLTNNVLETITTSNTLEDEPKKKVVDSCEDKMNKLKLLLQGRCKKPKIEKQVEIEPVTTYPTLTLDPEPQPLVKLPPRPKPSATVKDKRFKNPNSFCDKRRKSRMKKSIEDDLMFANEIGSEDLSSSIENSPSTNNMETYVGSRVKHIPNTETKPSQPKPVPRKDFFDEVAGCFQSGSVESDDSFQIVFHDSPRGRTSSDCDSEDSFIVFEDTPDSCYTSNDVFGDSDDESMDEEYDSDSDASDSGCGVFNLSGSLSKSVHNLADDSLYVDHSEDEVDCANVEGLTICDSVDASDIGDTGVSKGLLLDDRKKSLRKNLPAKKVHFSSDPPKVHVMRVWLYAAKQTRCRYWQQFAVDRERFKRRIADVDMAVSWVLKPQHRSRVMFQRFMPWWNAQKRREIAEKKEKESQEKLEEEEKLKNEEIEKNTELHKEKLEAHSNLDGDNTNKDNSKPEELEENLDNNDSYKTLINTVDSSEPDARNSVNSDKTMEENDNLIIKEVDCKNSTNFKSGSMENEKNTKKDLNGKLYSNEIVPFSDKKLDTDYVSLRTEYVKLNT